MTLARRRPLDPSKIHLRPRSQLPPFYRDSYDKHTGYPVRHWYSKKRVREGQGWTWVVTRDKTEVIDAALGVAGFRKGTAAEIMASALFHGGLTPLHIRQGVEAAYPDMSNNWTVTCSTVMTKMRERGFELDGHVRMLPLPDEELMEDDDD